MNPQNVAAIWLLDEVSGKLVEDSSGNGNDGELMNDPKQAQGKFGNALELDGTDDYVLVGDSPSLDITEQITITAWAKHAALDVNDVDKIFHYRRAGTTGGMAAYQFRFGGTDAEKGKKLIFQTNTAAEGWKHAFSESDTITDTSWHHYAATASKGKVVLYLDGEVIPSEGDVASKFDDGDQGYIGARVESKEYFNGPLDEVGIFNIALTAAEIKNIMTKGLQNALVVSSKGKLAISWGATKAQ